MLNMKHSNSLKKQLEEILSSQMFDKLDSVLDSTQRDEIGSDEKELLGLLFAKQGEFHLRKNRQHALDSFKQALDIAPKSEAVAFEVALAYSKYPQIKFCLNAAIDALAKVVWLNPNSYPAWSLWGFILT